MEPYNHAEHPRNHHRKAIPAMSRHGGKIVFSTHVTGLWVISLDENGAATLRDLLTKWLG